MLAGFLEMLGKGDGEVLSGTFKELGEAMFPFLVEERKKSDDEMKQVMQKEISRGPITFSSPVTRNITRNAMNSVRLSEEVRQKIANRSRRVLRQ
jgi:hypothetical protein